MLSEIITYTASFLGLFFAFFHMAQLFDNRERLKDPKPDYLPSITIAIPAYNAQSSIAKTIKSALKLKYPKNKLKIFVIDDGSEDNTYNIAKKFENSGNVKVFKKKNEGKGSALNFALKKCDSEIFATLDSDCELEKDSLLKMVGYFKDSNVHAVTSAVKIKNSKGILASTLFVEYIFVSVFIKKILSFMDSIYVLPGALSLLRTDIVKKLGGFDKNNLTEDLEIGLRIQKNGGKVENSINARVYTSSPTTFSKLYSQRLRWCKGLIDNALNYKEIFFNPKYGNLGLIVLPANPLWVFLIFAIVLNFLFNFLKGLYENLRILIATNFDILGKLNFQIDLFNVNLGPRILIIALSFSAYLLLLFLSHRTAKERKIGLRKIFLYVFLYPILLFFWWSKAIYYKISGKKIKWGKRLL